MKKPGGTQGWKVPGVKVPVTGESGVFANSTSPITLQRGASNFKPINTKSFQMQRNGRNRGETVTGKTAEIRPAETSRTITALFY